MPPTTSSIRNTGSDNGFLGYEQGTGGQPSDGQPVTYTSVPTMMTTGSGLFLLAGSQVYQLSPSRGIVLSLPVLTNNQVQLNFTVISRLTNVPLNLLQAGQLSAGWITNRTATFTTNVAGISYRFTATNNAAAGLSHPGRPLTAGKRGLCALNRYAGCL